MPTAIDTKDLQDALTALADERFGTGIGPLEPARPVR